MQKFERYEFKYILPNWIMDSVESEIMHFMQYDNFVKNKKDKSYFVRSLYFENKENENFYEKIDGLKFRKKYRIRSYSKSFNKNIFLEQKAKDNDRVFKKRISLKKNIFDKIIKNQINDVNFKSSNEINFYEDFTFKVLKKKEYPKIIIDYDRKPLISDYDSFFRISIDYNLVARNINMDKKIDCLVDHKIMEVKFFRRIPLWFHRIIQKYNLRRVSVSKFVVGMKLMGYAVDLS
tara:strand:- start:712 stop:1416 length:705 start_codon:yes stop_codon:yes gene_type:complete